MASVRDRRFFIIKHDLRSFQALPGIIWRTDAEASAQPRNFKFVRPGDRWVEFAYINDEEDREPCSFVLGFYECAAEAYHGVVPVSRKTEKWDRSWPGRAWIIEGRAIEPKLRYAPVAVPPINQILGRRVFSRGAIIPGISSDDFQRVVDEAVSRQLDPRRIPVFGRHPLNEQEVLAILAARHRQFGIDRLVSAQSAFPDVLASVDGREVYLELEVDSLNFWLHGHPEQLRQTPGGPIAKLPRESDNRPVAILSWVDGDIGREMKRTVAGLRVFELQSLIREGRGIDW